MTPILASVALEKAYLSLTLETPLQVPVAQALGPKAKLVLEVVSVVVEEVAEEVVASEVIESVESL